MKQAIILLGGGLVSDRRGHWRTTRFDEQGDRFGGQGDQLRIAAVAVLAKKHPRSMIIASGGKGQLKHIRGAPAVARVVKRELIGAGVAPARIVSESRSGTTFGQLWRLPPLLRQKCITQTLMISNRYHLPRIRALLRYHDALARRWRGIPLRLCAAEDLLVKHAPKQWGKTIARAYRSRAMRGRQAHERGGIAMIRAGTYHYRIT